DRRLPGQRYCLFRRIVPGSVPTLLREPQCIAALPHAHIQRAPGLALLYHLHKKTVRLPIDARGIRSQRSVPALDLPALTVFVDDVDLTFNFRRRVALGLKLLSVQLESSCLSIVSIEDFLRLRRLPHEPESPDFVDLFVRRPRSDSLLEILDRGLLRGRRRL